MIHKKLYCEKCNRETKKYYKIKETYLTRTKQLELVKKIRIKLKLCRICYKIEHKTNRYK